MSHTFLFQSFILRTTAIPQRVCVLVMVERCLQIELNKCDSCNLTTRYIQHIKNEK